MTLFLPSLLIHLARWNGCCWERQWVTHIFSRKREREKSISRSVIGPSCPRGHCAIFFFFFPLSSASVSISLDPSPWWFRPMKNGRNKTEPVYPAVALLHAFLNRHFTFQVHFFRDFCLSHLPPKTERGTKRKDDRWWLLCGRFILRNIFPAKASSFRFHTQEKMFQDQGNNQTIKNKPTPSIRGSLRAERGWTESSAKDNSNERSVPRFWFPMADRREKNKWYREFLFPSDCFIGGISSSSSFSLFPVNFEGEKGGLPTSHRSA